MKKLNISKATQSTATVFGVLAGLGGLTHGIGEVLQGNVKPEGIIINSWTRGPIATHMGGEPGMTIVPNLLLTGILTIVISVTTIIWAVVGPRKHKGHVLILLAVLMLLTGGGFGPPIIGLLAGIAGIGAQRPLSRWRKPLPPHVQRILAQAWPWVFGITTANGIFLVIGSVILVYGFDLNKPAMFTNSFFFSVVSLLLTIFVGHVYDLQRREERIGS